MDAQPTPDAGAPARDDLATQAAERHAAAGWQRLGRRLRCITPSGLMRFIMVVGALAALAWGLWQARVALTPFLFGLALAYITAPLVNRLDRALPRWIAVLLVVTGELALVIGLVALLVPAMLTQLGSLVTRLLAGQDLHTLANRLTDAVATLPPQTQALIRGAVPQIMDLVRTNAIGYLQGLLRLVAGGALSLLGTFGFVLSFLIVPTWLMSVLTDERAGLEAIDRQLPRWMRPDFWAVVRIVDRPLRAYVNGQLVMALAVGALSYLGLVLLQRLGWLSVEYKLLFALLGATLELIPIVGPILYALLAGLLGLAGPTQTGLLLMGLAVLSVLLANQLVAPRIERRYAGNIPSTVLAVAIVLISQLGLLWLVLAGPLTAIVVDLYRYVYGRFRDPPRPAGLLPGEPLPAPAPAPRPRRRFGRPAVAQPSNASGDQ